jgi:hypothetical protein
VRNRYLIVRYVNRDDRPPDSTLEEGSASQQSIRSDAFNDRRQPLHDGLRSTSSRPMTCSFALDVRKSRSIVGPPVASSCSSNASVVRILVGHRSFGTMNNKVRGLQCLGTDKIIFDSSIIIACSTVFYPVSNEPGDGGQRPISRRCRLGEPSSRRHRLPWMVEQSERRFFQMALSTLLRLFKSFTAIRGS